MHFENEIEHKILVTYVIAKVSACLNFGEFQHTAARRQLQSIQGAGGVFLVSTHSRPKAAAHRATRRRLNRRVSTHSRPKAAVPVCASATLRAAFQHTAARRRLSNQLPNQKQRPCLNTQPPEGGCHHHQHSHHHQPFQHTAARRRLPLSGAYFTLTRVSTHSRPKAAELEQVVLMMNQNVSTHSRPKAAADI